MYDGIACIGTVRVTSPLPHNATERPTVDGSPTYATDMESSSTQQRQNSGSNGTTLTPLPLPQSSLSVRPVVDADYIDDAVTTTNAVQAAAADDDDKVTTIAPDVDEKVTTTSVTGTVAGRAEAAEAKPDDVTAAKTVHDAAADEMVQTTKATLQISEVSGATQMKYSCLAETFYNDCFVLIRYSFNFA